MAPAADELEAPPAAAEDEVAAAALLDDVAAAAEVLDAAPVLPAAVEELIVKKKGAGGKYMHTCAVKIVRK